VSEIYESLCEVILGDRRILAGHVGPREDFGPEIRDLILLGLVRPVAAGTSAPLASAR